MASPDVLGRLDRILRSARQLASAHSPREQPHVCHDIDDVPLLWKSDGPERSERLGARNHPCSRTVWHRGSDSVRLEHANAHSWHHAGNSQFFDGHRQYIGKLEAFLLAQGLPQFVPLPKWDPATTIPGPFRAVKVLPAVAALRLGNVIANPSPNRPMPANLYNLTQFPSASALSGDPELVAWHGNVHVVVGGAMRELTVSPCAAVFWPWHAFIDDIYEDWIRRPQLVVTNFGYDAGGWRIDQHPRFLADLTGDGHADIIGFGNGGVSVSLNNGDGTFQAPQMVVTNFGSDFGGWRVDRHPRFLADLTGDRRAEIVGFGNAGVWIWRA